MGCAVVPILLVMQLSDWATGDRRIICELLFIGILLIILSSIFFIITKSIYFLNVSVLGIEFLISGFIEINYRKKKNKYDNEIKTFDLGKELKPIISKKP
jgi:hypothetical protein